MKKKETTQRTPEELTKTLQSRKKFRTTFKINPMLMEISASQISKWLTTLKYKAAMTTET